MDILRFSIHTSVSLETEVNRESRDKEPTQLHVSLFVGVKLACNLSHSSTARLSQTYEQQGFIKAALKEKSKHLHGTLKSEQQSVLEATRKLKSQPLTKLGKRLVQSLVRIRTRLRTIFITQSRSRRS